MSTPLPDPRIIEENASFAPAVASEGASPIVSEFQEDWRSRRIESS